MANYNSSHTGEQIDNLFNVIDNSMTYSSSNIGSNYIKFDNGIGICWGHADHAGVATTKAETIYVYTWDNVATFPFTFVDTPVVSVTPTHEVYCGILQNTFSTSGITRLVIWRPNSGNIWPYINYIAIGRWK